MIPSFHTAIGIAKLTFRFPETKQFLNGIKIESKDNRCDFISTDGFRLSLKYASFDNELPEFSCIVPFKTMNELSKILTSVKSETIQIHLSERQISFQVGTSPIVSRLINGRFPDYKQVIPKNTLFEYQISRQLLLNAADRANIIASHSNFVAKFNFGFRNSAFRCLYSSFRLQTSKCKTQLSDFQFRISDF